MANDLRFYRKSAHYNTRYQRSIHFKALRLYGGKCCRCGFSDWRALQFDHVKSLGTYSTKNVGRVCHYEEVIRSFDTGEFQLLCANCNTIKKYENSEGIRKELNEEVLKEMRTVPIEMSFC